MKVSGEFFSNNDRGFVFEFVNITSIASSPSIVLNRFKYIDTITLKEVTMLDNLLRLFKVVHIGHNLLF